MATARSSIYSFKVFPLKMFFTSYAGVKLNMLTPFSEKFSCRCLPGPSPMFITKERHLMVLRIQPDRQVALYVFQILSRLDKACSPDPNSNKLF